jgi:hypothetical protein
LKTDHNEQLVSHLSFLSVKNINLIHCTSLQTPEADAAIQSISIDPEATYMAAVNNKVFLLISVYRFPSLESLLTLTYYYCKLCNDGNWNVIAIFITETNIVFRIVQNLGQLVSGLCNIKL